MTDRLIVVLCVLIAALTIAMLAAVSFTFCGPVR